MKKYLVQIVLALAVVSLQAHAQGTLIFDQQSANNPVSTFNDGVDGFYIQTEPLTQSFIPAVSAIDFIQFEFEDVPGNGNNGATVYVNLWTGSPNVNSATLLGSTPPVYMPNGYMNNNLGLAGLTSFYFSNPIVLTPGQTYYFQPVVLSGDDPWAIITLTNTYAKGQLYGSGFAEQPGSDLWFREGITSVPEPSILALIGLAGVLVIARRCRKFLLTAFSRIVCFHLSRIFRTFTPARAVLATVVAVASLNSHAQGTLIFDQQSATGPVPILNNGNADGLNIQEDSPLMQSFIPTLSAIGFVQFEFTDFPNNGNNGATVYVNLWTGSPNTRFAILLGSTAAVYMPDEFMNDGLYLAGVTNFNFSTPVKLTPGQTYYLQPVVLSGDDPWDIITIGDTYSNGQLFGKTGGYFQPSTDFWFREGITSVPEPSILALIGLAGALVMARRCRKFLLTAFSRIVCFHLSRIFRTFTPARAVLATVVAVASLNSHAQGTLIFDQQSATSPLSSFGNDFFNIQTEPLTQSFIPTFSAIDFVQFEFWDIPNNGNNGATVYVNLWTGSPNINSATLLGSTAEVYMPEGFGSSSPGVTSFYFATPVILDPGQTYYLQPVVASGDNPWDIWAPGDTYSNGELFAAGSPFDNSVDLWFREGITSVPEPSVLAFVGLVGGLVMARRRCRKFLSVAYGGVASFRFPTIFKTFIPAQTLLAVACAIVALRSHAQGTLIFDQQSATGPVPVLNNGNADGLNIQEDSPLTQSFVPTLSAIEFVQLEFWDIPNNGNNGATVYVNLWAGSPNPRFATLLGSTAAVYMPDGFVTDGLLLAGISNFNFSTPINVTPGQTYYLQPIVLSGDDPWDVITIGDTYPNGQEFEKGLGFGTDMWFREGIDAVPEPSILALIGLAGVVVIARVRGTAWFCWKIWESCGSSLPGMANDDGNGAVVCDG